MVLKLRSVQFGKLARPKSETLTELLAKTLPVKSAATIDTSNRSTDAKMHPVKRDWFRLTFLKWHL
jgi:hypothetical protein